MTVPPYGPPGWPGPGEDRPQPGPPAAPTSDERSWAAAAHAGSLVAAWFAMGFLCPLLVLLLKGKESPFIRRHALESLNFQISLLIYLVVCLVLVFVLVGFLLLLVLGVFALTVLVLATVAAWDGRDFRYPLIFRFVS